MIFDTDKVCCFTGHRDIPAIEERKIMTRARYIIDRMIWNEYVTTFIVGGAIGFDMLAAEEIIRRKQTNARIKLISVLPFEGYNAHWENELRQRALHIRMHCSEVVYASDKPSKYSFLVRDRMMVDRSDYCVSYCNRTTGGTAYTVRYAYSKRIPVFNASSWDTCMLTYY